MPEGISLTWDSKSHQIDNTIASGDGMMTMDQLILALYKFGRITAEAALHYADAPKQMRRRMGGR